MLIKSYGLFWRERDVFWGRPNHTGRLLGVPAASTKASPVDFREQAGVYVLYADYRMVYVGQAGEGDQNLFDRLKQHRRDALAQRWDQFSWFGIRRVLQTGELAMKPDGVQSSPAEVLNHIEGILIHAAEPPLNRQGGRFGPRVEQYLQRRDKKLGLTTDDKVSQILSLLKPNGAPQE